jgi:hypothetical protein
VKEVLPASTVTDLNRDGLLRRIPRRLTNDATTCIECVINYIASDIGDNEVVIVITGDQSIIDVELFHLVEDNKIPIFLISYPAIFQLNGINVPQDYLPNPLSYGNEQSCTVGVPWPNGTFYFAIIAEDGAGNRGLVSNIVSLYIHEEVTTITPAADSHQLLLLFIFGMFISRQLGTVRDEKNI